MRFRSSFYLNSLIALSLANQQVFSSTKSISTSAIKVVDFLYDGQHDLLLSCFQVARLIPVLNELNHTHTLFAIKESYIEEARKKEMGNGIWSLGTSNSESLMTRTEEERDNLQLSLRDTLLYHILNYTIQPKLISSTPLLLESLYFPRISNQIPIPTLPGSPPDNNSSYSHPIGNLKNHGQKLRIVERKTKKGGEIYLGTDWIGDGGILVDEGLKNASNGLFFEINGILDKPVDIATQIRSNPNLSIISSLLPTQILNYLTNSKHITYFAPLNEAFDALSPLERKFLESSFAETDLLEIFGAEVVREGDVGYLDVLMGVNRTEAGNVTTILGNPLSVYSAKNGSATVNGSIIETGDIFASNGVIHTVSNLLLPTGSLALTAEKTLIALNATKFTVLLRANNLSSYVQHTNQDSSNGFTILAPKNEDFDNPLSNWNSLPPNNSVELKDLLLYHLLENQYLPANLSDEMLLFTESKGEERNNQSQVISVSVNKAKEPKSLSKWKGLNQFKKEEEIGIVVGFGGSTVIGEPVIVGNNVIYMLNSILELPTTMISTALNLELSTFVAAVYSTGLNEQFDSLPSSTFLIPNNLAWNELGLIQNYLLLPTSKAELITVLNYGLVKEIAYSENFSKRESKTRFPTLDGSEIYIAKGKHDKITIHGPTVGGESINGEIRDAEIIQSDILISTGVIHIIDQVELPPTLNVDMVKLLKGAKVSIMINLLIAGNFSWLLNGQSPPADFMINKNKKKEELITSYTLLCPSDKSFNQVNITTLMNDPIALNELLSLHIIPSTNSQLPTQSNLPINLVDEISYKTLLPGSYGELAFRKLSSSSEFVVGIKSARGTKGQTDSAKIINFGKISPKLQSNHLIPGGGVLILDSVLIPYQIGFFVRNGWKFISFGIILGCLAMIGWLVRSVYKGKQLQRYDQLEGEED